MANRIDLLEPQERRELEQIILEIRQRDDTTDADWKKAVGAIFAGHGFTVIPRFIVNRRGDYYRGRVGLVCRRNDLTVAMEFGNRSVKRNCVTKLSQVSPTAIRLVGLRAGAWNGEIAGIDRVFSRLQSGAGLPLTTAWETPLGSKPY